MMYNMYNNNNNDSNNNKCQKFSEETFLWDFNKQFLEINYFHEKSCTAYYISDAVQSLMRSI